MGQMSRIREKATESEAVVRNITKEIQVLDLAKKNLILSMTTLKRLQMLGALLFPVLCPSTQTLRLSEHIESARGPSEGPEVSRDSANFSCKSSSLTTYA